MDENQKVKNDGEAVMNRAKGLEYCADSPEIYCEMLTIFCSMRETSGEELDRCLKERDWKNYTIKVHALKTNAKSIGAFVMGELCYELELAGKKIQAGDEVAEQEALIREKHPKMLLLFDRTVAEANDYMKNV